MKKIILTILISSILTVVGIEVLERGRLSLPTKETYSKTLIETKKYLKGSPLAIQRWLTYNITGKSDGGIQYAQSPEETFEKRTGDCEDYAIITKYFLEGVYEEVYIVSWLGDLRKDSKNYSNNLLDKLWGKNLIGHAICVFKIDNNVWGVMDGNGFIISGPTLEEAIKYDCKVRKVKIISAYIREFKKYSVKKIKKLKVK